MDRFDCIFHIKPGFKKNILVKSFTVVYNATNDLVYVNGEIQSSSSCQNYLSKQIIQINIISHVQFI